MIGSRICGIGKQPGGKNHFAADREAAEHALLGMPSGRIAARENRKFLGRRVAFQNLTMVPPGVVILPDWRPDTSEPRPSAAEVSGYAGVAYKP
jgi:hypothetical protein